MTPLWIAIAVLAIVAIVPSPLGSFLLAEHAPAKVLPAWFTLLALILAVGILFTALAMPVM